jgi:hypothetical protein
VGVYTFDVTVTDGSESATAPVSIEIDAASSAPGSNDPPAEGIFEQVNETYGLDTGTVGVDYGASLYVDFPSGSLVGSANEPLPLSWSLEAGSSLPPGLILDMARGVVRGVPTTAGTYDFSVIASGNGQAAEGSYEIEVDP